MTKHRMFSKLQMARKTNSGEKTVLGLKKTRRKTLQLLSGDRSPKCSMEGIKAKCKRIWSARRTKKKKMTEGRVLKKHHLRKNNLHPITALIYFYYFFAEVQNQGKGECL